MLSRCGGTYTLKWGERTPSLVYMVMHFARILSRCDLRETRNEDGISEVTCQPSREVPRFPRSSRLPPSSARTQYVAEMAAASSFCLIDRPDQRGSRESSTPSVIAVFGMGTGADASRLCAQCAESSREEEQRSLHRSAGDACRRQCGDLRLFRGGCTSSALTMEAGSERRRLLSTDSTSPGSSMIERLDATRPKFAGDA